MEYKRLTRKIMPNKDTVSQYTACEYVEIYQNGSALCQVTNRLGELEDKIENGTLVELPCKVGDKVFSIWAGIGQDYTIKDDTVWYLTVRHNLYITTDYIEDGLFGTDVFLTKEEAEAKLKELQNKE